MKKLATTLEDMVKTKSVRKYAAVISARIQSENGVESATTNEGGNLQ